MSKKTSTANHAPKKTGAKYSARAVSRRYNPLKRRYPNANDLLRAEQQSWIQKTRVIEKPQSARERELKVRYEQEREVELKVAQLLNLYSPVGLTRAAAVQAVKTNWVPSLTTKWNQRLGEWKRVQDALRRGRMGDLLTDAK